MGERRVVITGMGAITPLGCTVDAFWDGLISARSGITALSLFDPADYDTKIAGECRDFDATRWLEPKSLKRLDRFAQFALAAAIDAVKASGLDLAKEDPANIGVIVGSGIGGIKELQDQYLRLMQKGPSRISAFTIPKLMANAAAGNIAIHFGCQGPSTAVVTACASATHAMGDALRAIQRGDAEAIITGGSEAAVTELSVGAFNAMHALSTRNAEPTRASRPFDRHRDGFVIGEGAGIVIFEERERAIRRGANIQAEVLGFGMSTDGGHITQPDDAGTGAARAMQLCMKDARLAPEDLQYINAHGTSTPLGDIAETRAIKRVFGEAVRKIAISSTKSATGHLLGASGGIELIASIQALRHGILPPTLNLDEPDDECDLDYVPHKARDQKIHKVMSNSFGFGGHNACILVGRHD